MSTLPSSAAFSVNEVESVTVPLLEGPRWLEDTAHLCVDQDRVL